MTIESLPMELSTLGSCILSARAVDEVSRFLKPEHFARPSHGTIYRAMLDLRAKREPIDLVTLTDHLGGELPNVGGKDYLIQVAEYVPSPDNAAYYAKKVIHDWRLREYKRIAHSVNADSDPDEVAIRLKAVTEGAGLPSIESAVVPLGKTVPKRKAGIATSVVSLNETVSSGGWTRGQTAIVLAYTGSGKTAFMLQETLFAAKQGRRPIFATFADMSEEELTERAMRQLTGFGFAPDLQHKLEEWDRSLDWLKGSGILVYDATRLSSGFDVETFAAWCEHNAPQHKATELYIDYAQELTTRERVDGDYARNNVCATVVNRLVRTLGLPGIVGSQVTEGKNGERDKTKGSRVWEEKAALVLKLKRDEDTNDADLIVSKNRFGPKTTIPLLFMEDRVSFQEVAR